MKGRVEKKNLEAKMQLGSIAIDRERDGYDMKWNSSSRSKVKHMGSKIYLGGGMIRTVWLIVLGTQEAEG